MCVVGNHTTSTSTVCCARTGRLPNTALHRYLKENNMPHVWHVDSNAHDGTEWANNLYLFAQHLFR